jgi:hypothetical protein
VRYVEVLHLDEMGYGPSGNLTRRQWRDACVKVMAQRRQEGWGPFTNALLNRSSGPVSFEAVVHHEDGRTIPLLNEHEFPSTSIDLVGANVSVSAEQAQEGKCFVPFLAAGANVSNAQFATFHFTAGASFRWATFSADSNFSNCHLVEFANFTHATFLREVNFKRATLACDTTFANAKFGADAVFALTQFDQEARFDDATFLGVAQFDQVKANGGLWFDCATFDGDARFGAVKFPALARFAHATFRAGAVFNNATFAHDAAFNDATFFEAAQFDGATFEAETSFAGAEFKDEAGFFRAEFKHRSDFENATFAGSVNFENATFTNVGQFTGVVFAGKSPSFLGVDRKTVLLFRGSTFPMPSGEAIEMEHYGALKSLSEAQGHGAQTLMFNALELASRQRSGVNPVWRHTTWLYGAVADYGQSYLRPLAVLLVVSALTWIFAITCAALNSPPLCPGSPLLRIGSDLARARAACDNTGYAHRTRVLEIDETTGPLQLSGYRAATEYVLLGGLGIFEFPGKDRRIEPINMRLYAQPLEPWYMRTWGVFRGVAGAALLFLTALGLRNSYRIK